MDATSPGTPPGTPPGTLRPGTALLTERGGHEGRIIGLLGLGGQGAVYEAEIRGTRFAAKWYHPSYAAVDEALRPRLLRTVERGAPDDSFLWPLDLVRIAGEPSFGYIMRLRDTGYAGMRDLIARPPARIEPRLAVRATICLHIAQSFLALHASGFCYQDINFGNVFFRPADGAVLICDNDNVDVDGAPPSVFGTRKFMAPEVVRREAMPGTRTDLFSMAVLFFYVLHAWHPLDGAREAAVRLMDAKAETELYGTRPLFLFDPADASNGPVPGMHEPVAARWHALPAGVRALLTRSFTTGLHQPGARVQEAEWCGAFAAMAVSGYPCAGCGFEHTAGIGPDGAVAGPPRCLACDAPLPLPPVLALGRTAACLLPGAVLPRRFLNGGEGGGATVERHPTRADVIGLRNAGPTAWQAELPGGGGLTVAPGSAVRLLDGMAIRFGPTPGGGVTGRVLAPATERVTA